MTQAITADENSNAILEKPGAQLAAIRQQKGYTTEYVAGKLHLRVNMIELIEADDYANMPQPVFIKGYLRAYAKLLHLPYEPLIQQFNELNSHSHIERKFERALWQNRREPNKAEHAVRWLTSIFAVIVLAAVAMWWHTNKENEHLFHANVNAVKPTQQAQSETEVKLTDLSKMRSLLSSTLEPQALETDSD